MQKKLNLIPIWLWVIVIVIMVFLFSSCRGGRSLGKGSAGTVIVPQTPQEINERNAAPSPPLEPLPPTPISIAPAPPKNPTVITPTPVAPPVAPPAAPPKAVRSTPTPPESKSAEANPVIINPKPAGKLNPFSPSVSPAPPIITAPEKNLPTDNETTDGEIVLDPRELPEKKSSWWNLIYYWLFAILMIVFGWIAYDTVRPLHSKFLKENKPQKPTKKPAKATRASRKKALSKKNEKPKR